MRDRELFFDDYVEQQKELADAARDDFDRDGRIEYELHRAAERAAEIAAEPSDLSPRGSAQSGASAQTRQARPD